MAVPQFHPEAARLIFVVLSFEGPDRYAMAGGLATRVTGLTEALARLGFETQLIFVGDPEVPGHETRQSGRLHLHRWCQWISRYHPGGVYDGEEGKLRDYQNTVPDFVLNEIVRPALAGGKRLVVMAEEWQTAETLARLGDRLQQAGLRDQAQLLWNANNTMSFHRINWDHLSQAATITTVSRYMKHLMWPMGLNPLVIPNGIPAHLLHPVKPTQIDRLRRVLDAGTLLVKIARFDPDKRWLMAVETVARLKAKGQGVALLARGGVEVHGEEVMAYAQNLGLIVRDVQLMGEAHRGYLLSLRAAGRADIYNLHFHIPEDFRQVMYAAANLVLANSGREPFGLVGLEAMAAGGVAVTGSTGEDYVVPFENALALDTDDPAEVVTYLHYLRENPDREREIRGAARETARQFTWDAVVGNLLNKLNYLKNGSTDNRKAPDTARNIVIYAVLHQPRRLRLPAAPIPPGARPADVAHTLFDEPMNQRYFEKVAQTAYRPTAALLRELVDGGLKVNLGFSFSWLRQAEAWDPALLDQFRDLVAHPNVELVAVEPYHSFIMLLDLPAFVRQMRWARGELRRIFGKTPVVADTTEMALSDGISHALERAGFQAALLDGRPWVLGWREPTHLYHPGPGRKLRLLTRHLQLSDDVGYRFSNQGWSGWPLLASTYTDWLAAARGEYVLLGWDFETFGEHHRAESGIFDFLRWLPQEASARRLSFLSASEAVALYREQAFHLPLPAFPATWAGSGGMEFFLGNPAQQAVFQLMGYAYNKACLTGDRELIDIALWLCQSDHLHLIQWYGRSGAEAEVSSYFTPREWWTLGPDGIVWEIQQVYKNFIVALDAYLQHQRKGKARHAA